MMLRLLIAAWVIAAVCVPAQAQPPAETKVTPTGSLPTALVVEVTISRHQGDKRLSSMPYTIAVTPEARANLRVGGQIPIPMIAPPPKGAEEKPAAPYSYRDIGTNIDITATPADAGRYRVSLTVEESSVYPPAEAAKNSIAVTGAPSFRSLRSSNAVLLRDGQTVEYVAATDRVTGETARISVKLTVLK